MKFDELVNCHKNDFSDTEMAILKYIFQHRKEIKHISIHKLAKDCAVSSTAIVRFSQKLGLDGFAELKAILKIENSSEQNLQGDQLKKLQNFYLQTSTKTFQWNFDEANHLINKSQRVFAFASGYVQNNVLQELKRLFFYDNVFIYEIKGREEFHSISHTLTKNDMFIFISLSGETPIVIDFAQQLQFREIPFISITKLHDNTLAGLSTVNLYISSIDFKIHDEEVTSVSFKSMLPYFMLVEVWYFKYRLWLSRQTD